MEELLRQSREIEARARAVAARAESHNTAWRHQGDAWTVAQCFDHLAKTNSLYLDAMLAGVLRDRKNESERSASVLLTPGFWGRLVVRSLEPSRLSPRMKAPAAAWPSPMITIAEAYEKFVTSHLRIVRFAEEHRSLDLASISFQSPFVGFLKLSVATGLFAVCAHERRHIIQAQRILESKL